MITGNYASSLLDRCGALVWGAVCHKHIQRCPAKALRLQASQLTGELVQAIIGHYAVPILGERQVWGTIDETRTTSMDSCAAHSFHNFALHGPCVLNFVCVKATKPHRPGGALGVGHRCRVQSVTSTLG